MSMQQQIIDDLKVKPTIDPAAEIRKRVDFLKSYIEKSGSQGLLIAISGGIDSAVATGLCKQATDELTAEKGTEYKTVGVFQPYSTQSDIEDSYAVAEAFKLTYKVETNVHKAVDAIEQTVNSVMPQLEQDAISPQAKGNIKARTRMVVQYAIANSLNLLVVGTDHASEAITGFFTKYGDGAVDITPLSTLDKRQVRELAAHLSVPQSVLDKAPSAGLWENQTDESELGITYADNCDYLEGKSVAPEVAERLESYYKRTAHKRDPIPGI
ncbi:ammonia-dependent NAD(+) synthetase [Paenibacillus campi]|uniref:ammonia-dependent NAD(+) synthetase n=1 Tax=Paenibacillus campi TaxID=3106031 RepID=UPI002B002D51|nr:ammonia-dependent NAD(+) synthetase [Paenibacillus sp. SGZ-1009]